MCSSTFGIFKMAAVAMEMAKMLKNWKTQKWSAGYSPNRNWSSLLGTTSTTSGTR
jgi:hypothetical protein